MELNIGEVVEGKITGISKFGAFVEIAPGKSGLVHISEISNDYISDINDIYKVGDVVKVKLISAEGGKISLSIKQTLPADGTPVRERRAKRVSTPRPRYQSPGRPGDAVWETSSVDSDLSFEDKLKRFQMASDEKLSELKRKNNNDGKRRGRRGAVPTI